ncbi:MAG: hypothetical protein DYG94_11685 [Leptolyngbya sp. PLA3]|nr:MAG: hypothetical protein EDM82_13035 [Cyanobacteria bacterium CYA]MCE7969385.1 hypothetical protein [Leptolyngbya sp. PL-A3]
MIQDSVSLITLIGVGLIAGVFVFVFLCSKPPGDSKAVKHRWYAVRPYWLLVLVGLGTWAGTATLGGLPYTDTHSGASGGLEVEVIGRQWAWQISRTSLPANTPIQFRVTSVDVNHGFAIYDRNWHVLAQTQAMPGRTNTLSFSFDTPGQYTILCLEYCGVAHHTMASVLTVTGE